MKEANRTQITETICKQAQLMRRGGANQTEIGKLLGVNPCTISRMEKAGFDLATYQATRRLEKQKEKQKAPEVKLIIRSEDLTATEEQVPGQLRMEIPEKVVGVQMNTTYADEISGEYPERVKLMRFQAHMTEDLKKTMIDMISIVTVNQNKLYDMVCQLIRAIRKE